LAQGIAPRYEVDVTFPQPFPDLWVTGGFGGHCIDAQDHVLLLNRQDVLDGELNSGHLAPLMIELDPTGKVVHSWGDPNLVEGTVAGLRKSIPAAHLPFRRGQQCLDCKLAGRHDPEIHP